MTNTSKTDAINSLIDFTFKMEKKNREYANIHTMAFETARAQGRQEVYSYMANILNAIKDGDTDMAINMMEVIMERA